MAQYFANKVINTAQSQIGYQESGNNHTKYASDLGFGQNQAWCQTFVCWCFVQAYGRDAGVSLMCGYMGASTMECKDRFASKGQLVQVPQPGDIWWRKRSGGGHVGIIVSARLNGNSIVINTVEGNTSPPSSGGSEWNGDGVYPKTHTITNGRDENGNQSWFGRPAYDGQGSNNPYVGGAVSEGISAGGGSPAFGPSTGGFSVFDLAENLSNSSQSLVNKVQTVGDDITTIFGGLVEAFGARLSGQQLTGTFEIAYETVTTTIVRDEIKSITDFDKDKLGTNLLTYPSLVESPYVILKVGNYTFGSYSKKSINGKLQINYPNYITRLGVRKINGQVNKYTITLVYQISYGDDPNLLDRIFSSVGYGLVKISYGDWASPTFIYKEEEAIVNKLSSQVEFAQSRITYTLECTSNALVLASGYFDFEKVYAKPSDRIKSILFDSRYGLQEVFPGMSNKTKVNQLNLIASDDKVVEIEAKHGIDALSYINYLVTCMSSVTNKDTDTVIKDSAYFMTIYDDTLGNEDLNGSYFKVTKVTSDRGTLTTPDVYVVDIGYPTNNLVTNFQIVNDNSWALLYNYSDTVDMSEYMYHIDNSGNLITEYSPAVATSAKNFKMTESQKTWWTNMTQFPIKAELTIKGLVRSALLMSYVRINAYFFGQKHISSGLYVITKQQDTIDGQGYRTQLSLLRVAGDNDYITKVETTVTSNLPVSIVPTGGSVTMNTEAAEKLTAIGNRIDSTVMKFSNKFNDALDDAVEFVGSYVGGAFTESSIDGDVSTVYEGYGGNEFGGQGRVINNGNIVGAFKGKSYQCTDAQLLGIAAGCIAEQGSGTPGVGWECSLLCNLVDSSSKYDNPYDYMLNSGWFASRTKRFIKNSAYIGANIDGYVLEQKHFNLVKDIVVNGNRLTKANEHDSVNDIEYVEVNGKKITNSSVFKNKKDSSVWISGVTKVYNKMGARYTFIGFPNGDTRYDPFGVKF